MSENTETTGTADVEKNQEPRINTIFNIGRNQDHTRYDILDHTALVTLASYVLTVTVSFPPLIPYSHAL